MEASCWERLTLEKTRSYSDGCAMLRKYLVRFSLDEWVCVPSMLFDLRPNFGGGNEDNGTSFKRPHAGTEALSAPDTKVGLCQPTPMLETSGHSQVSLSQPLVGSLILSPGFWQVQDFFFFFALQESVSLVVCKL